MTERNHPYPDTVGVVVADFYKDISDALLESCCGVLKSSKRRYEVYTVPGALEIAPAIQRLHVSCNLGCFVALGCIIRGETHHFEVVAKTSAAALMQLQLQLLPRHWHPIAIGNGILTVENKAQALARVDKGAAAAKAALQLDAI